ncbi:MAG: hypothetical protein ACK5P7_07895 [Bdellovibrio sp.]
MSNKEQSFSYRDRFADPGWPGSMFASAGGDHDLNNLRALCKKHNLHRYHQQAQRRFF